MNAVQASDEIIKMTIEQPVSSWAKTLYSLDIQHHYDQTFGGMVAFVIKLILPSFATDSLLPYLAEQFVRGQKNKDFLVDVYLPELNKVTENLHITLFQKITLTEKFIGMIIKIGYAIIWHEDRFNSKFLY
jgi:hypothetical protein